MLISNDELMYLQSQLEGLESIFWELMPFGVELKRHEVQHYYEKRFEQATKPVPPVAEGELRRQFNTKANQVRNLVDSAESLGDVANKFNLIRAAATLPAERTQPLAEPVEEFCQKLIDEEHIDSKTFDGIMDSEEIGAPEARVLLASAMFMLSEELKYDGKSMLLSDLLAKLIHLALKRGVLMRNDPFLIEANCALESLKEESEVS